MSESENDAATRHGGQVEQVGAMREFPAFRALSPLDFLSFSAPLCLCGEGPVVRWWRAQGVGDLIGP